MMAAQDLPRLLYVGDVPIEESTGGSNLLFRLLRNYPADRLLVLESNYASEFRQAWARRLPEVEYQSFHLGKMRYLRSRMRSLLITGLLLSAPGRAYALGRVMAAFRPEAVLTVGFGYSWNIARWLAKQQRARFHFLVCDDYQSLVPGNAFVRWLANKVFGVAYRAADARLCLTPDIDRMFSRLYGTHGETLWIPRPAQCVENQSAAPRVTRSWTEGMVCAYAGTIWDVEPFETLARCLRSVGGTLRLFSAGDKAIQLASTHPNVECRAQLATDVLIATLRAEADVLVVPMSFTAEGKPNAEASFPSKLIDYTATGLPILIWAPAYASATRWVEQFPGSAKVVSTNDEDALRMAFVELGADAARRIGYAETALQNGNRLFSHGQVTARFQKILAGRK